MDTQTEQKKKRQKKKKSERPFKAICEPSLPLEHGSHSLPCRDEMCPDVEGLIGQLEDAENTVSG